MLEIYPNKKFSGRSFNPNSLRHRLAQTMRAMTAPKGNKRKPPQPMANPELSLNYDRFSGVAISMSEKAPESFAQKKKSGKGFLIKTASALAIVGAFAWAGHAAVQKISTVGLPDSFWHPKPISKLAKANEQEPPVQIVFEQVQPKVEAPVVQAPTAAPPQEVVEKEPETQPEHHSDSKSEFQLTPEMKARINRLDTNLAAAIKAGTAQTLYPYYKMVAEMIPHNDPSMSRERFIETMTMYLLGTATIESNLGTTSRNALQNDPQPFAWQLYEHSSAVLKAIQSKDSIVIGGIDYKSKKKGSKYLELVNAIELLKACKGNPGKNHPAALAAALETRDDPLLAGLVTAIHFQKYSERTLSLLQETTNSETAKKYGSGAIYANHNFGPANTERVTGAYNQAAGIYLPKNQKEYYGIENNYTGKQILELMTAYFSVASAQVAHNWYAITSPPPVKHLLALSKKIKILPVSNFVKQTPAKSTPAPNTAQTGNGTAGNLAKTNTGKKTGNDPAINKQVGVKVPPLTPPQPVGKAPTSGKRTPGLRS